MRNANAKPVTRMWVVGLLLAGSVSLVLLIAPRGQAQKPKQPAGRPVLLAPVHASLAALRDDDEDRPCARFQEEKHDEAEAGEHRHDGEDEDRELNNRIRRGFAIAPVPLNLKGKNCALVGLGSYLVNLGNCNDCHSNGPATQFVMGGNPFFGQPKQTNPATYLGGGRNFGKLQGSGPQAPDIISRNLTPSTKTGLPEGDHTFEEFLTILRTGKDFDHLHPNCSPPGVTTNCLNHPPFDGDLLQNMPWPNLQSLTDHDIRAIYEYLRAIPCIRGNYPGEPADRCQ